MEVMSVPQHLSRSGSVVPYLEDIDSIHYYHQAPPTLPTIENKTSE